MLREKLSSLHFELDYARKELQNARYSDEQNWWHRIILEINLEIAEITGKLVQKSV